MLKVLKTATPPDVVLVLAPTRRPGKKSDSCTPAAVYALAVILRSKPSPAPTGFPAPSWICMMMAPYAKLAMMVDGGVVDESEPET